MFHAITAALPKHILISNKKVFAIVAGSTIFLSMGGAFRANASYSFAKTYPFSICCGEASNHVISPLVLSPLRLIKINRHG
jgi:hypothetical protein